MTGSPSSSPSVRGKVSRRSASSSVTVSSDIDFSSEDVRGLPVAPSGSTSVTYGPNRPLLATIWWPLAGSVPSATSLFGWSNNSAAFSGVSSSGAMSPGTFTRWPSRSR